MLDVQCRTNGLEQKLKDHKPYPSPQSSCWKGSQNLWQSCKGDWMHINDLNALLGLYPKNYNRMNFFYSIRMGKSRVEERCTCLHSACHNSYADTLALSVAALLWKENRTIKLFCWLCLHGKNAMAPILAMAIMLIKAPFPWLPSNIAVTSLVLVYTLEKYSSYCCKNAFSYRWNTFAFLLFPATKIIQKGTQQSCCQSP